MRRFLAQEIIRTWEWGHTHHPLDRALCVLALAYPERSWEELATLSIGQRNLRLLAVHEQVAGPTLNCFVACPQCATALEFTVQVADIRVSSLDETLAQAYDLCVDGVTLRFHLPNSRDLAAIVTADGLPAARRVLLQRCLHQTTRDGTVLALSDVPETVLAMLTEQMFDLDPQAGLRFNLACEACGQQWSAPFDIAAFVWTEIAAMAQRLLHEVHILAMTYGWHESDILAMDAVRRQLYLDMIGA